MMVYGPASQNSTNRDPFGADVAVRQDDDLKMTANFNFFFLKNLHVSRITPHFDLNLVMIK